MATSNRQSNELDAATACSSSCEINKLTPKQNEAVVMSTLGCSREGCPLDSETLEQGNEGGARVSLGICKTILFVDSENAGTIDLSEIASDVFVPFFFGI